MDYIVYKASAKLKLSHLPELIDRGKIEGHFKFLVMKLVSKKFNYVKFLILLFN